MSKKIYLLAQATPWGGFAQTHLLKQGYEVHLEEPQRYRGLWYWPDLIVLESKAVKGNASPADIALASRIRDEIDASKKDIAVLVASETCTDREMMAFDDIMRDLARYDSRRITYNAKDLVEQVRKILAK